MGFDTITDKWGRTITPRKRMNSKGRAQHLAFVEPFTWGGQTSSGIFLDHGGEDLPITYGVIRAIRHDSPVCVANLPREAGGLMPGDLVHYPRHSTMKISDIDLLTTTTDFEGECHEYTFETPLLVIVDSEIIARIDGIIEDPWQKALEDLPPAERSLS